MGQGEGKAASGNPDVETSLKDLSSVEGFQLVRLVPHSPAYNAGLTPYFDIITALDHVPLKSDTFSPFQYFRNYIAEHKERSVCFTVYNLRIRAFREVHLTPSAAWGGGGILGCSIEWACADQAIQRTWHIIDVLEGSPASYCPDIHAERDYIIGMQQPEEQLISLLKSDGDFHSRLEMWQALQRSAVERSQRFPNEQVDIPHNILFLVYDSEEAAVKEVLIEVGTEPGTPLGVNVASGLLHIIPSVSQGGASSLPVMNRFYIKNNFVMEANTTTTAQQQQQQPPAFQHLPAPPQPQIEEQRTLAASDAVGLQGSSAMPGHHQPHQEPVAQMQVAAGVATQAASPPQLSNHYPSSALATSAPSMQALPQQHVSPGTLASNSSSPPPFNPFAQLRPTQEGEKVSSAVSSTSHSPSSSVTRVTAPVPAPSPAQTQMQHAAPQAVLHQLFQQQQQQQPQFQATAQSANVGLQARSMPPPLDFPSFYPGPNS